MRCVRRLHNLGSRGRPCRRVSTSWPARREAPCSRMATGHRGKMEVAVSIGTDPALTFSAIVPAPPDAPGIHHRRFPAAETCGTGQVRDVNLEVPADSEIVLEGYVKLGSCAREGPFGDHTGFDSLKMSIRFSTSPA